MPNPETVTAERLTAERLTADPPFRQIERDLRERLSRGEWLAGRSLPSRRSLAQEYGVAVRTVERAVECLRMEGLLRSDGRLGTFAASPAREDASMEEPRRMPPRTATLGLLDTNSLDTHAPRHDEYGWIDTIATHAERTFAQSGGTARYFDVFGSGRGRLSVAEALGVLASEGVDALIVIGIFDSDTLIREVSDALEGLTLPAVYVSWKNIAAPVAHVFYDNVLAGQQAGQHLKRAGYGDVWFFAPFSAPWAEERLLGLRQAAPPVSAYPLDRPVGEKIADWEASRALARALLSESRAGVASAPPGITAANDTLALMVLEATAECGLSPGPDFGLVGFDDQPLARRRGLTSLHPPLEALGEQAARMVLSRLAGDATAHQLRLRSHLLPRASTRRVRL